MLNNYISIRMVLNVYCKPFLKCVSLTIIFTHCFVFMEHLFRTVIFCQGILIRIMHAYSSYRYLPLIQATDNLIICILVSVSSVTRVLMKYTMSSLIY